MENYNSTSLDLTDTNSFTSFLSSRSLTRRSITIPIGPTFATSTRSLERERSLDEIKKAKQYVTPTGARCYYSTRREITMAKHGSRRSLEPPHKYQSFNIPCLPTSDVVTIV